MTELERVYADRRQTVLEPIAEGLGEQLAEYLRDQPRIDRISVRAKSVDSFIRKASAVINGAAKYTDPLTQIQDQVGARIITFYKSDIERVSAAVRKYYRPIEAKQLVPDHYWKFG